MPLRLRDYVAWQITAMLSGSPRFQPCWPERDRDRALDGFARFLQKYGTRITPDTGFETRLYRPAVYGRPEIAFDTLASPATPDDVRAGRAIFTLSGHKGARRVASLTGPLPIRYAFWRFGDGPAGSVSCVVWQAEEIQSKGSWHRYYGIVSGNQIVRVPAEQVILPK